MGMWKHLNKDYNWLFYYMKTDHEQPVPEPARMSSCFGSTDILSRDLVDFVMRELGSATVLEWIRSALLH